MIVSANNQSYITNSKNILLNNVTQNSYVSDSNKMLIRIYDNDFFPQENDYCEVVGYSLNKWTDVIISKDLLSDLDKQSIAYEIVIENLEEYYQTMAVQYHTLQEMEEVLTYLSETYPDICNLYSIGKSYEGRDILCLEITDNPGFDEDEPGIFYMGLHHAREWPSLEICLYIAEKLVDGYNNDPQIKELVENRRIWIVPCVNPDGYYFCHDHGHDWRKNRHYFPEYGTYGVDLNRNYPGTCNDDVLGLWGTLGVDHRSDSETYCGTYPLSELETQAIKNMFVDNKIHATISWHTHSELVMWPWGYSGTDKTPDDEYMARVGAEIASRITKQEGTGTYDPIQSAGLYSTTGDTTDWAYSYSHYVQGKTMFAYTIEACDSFHPGSGELTQICQENYEGALYLIEEAENIRDTVVPRVAQPVINELETDLDGNYVVSWVEKNNDADPSVFQLDQMSGITYNCDDSSLSTEWIFEDVTRINTQFHSDQYSYSLMPSAKPFSYMVTKNPIPITENTKLSFWSLYNIKENNNFVYIEISRDGRYFDIISKLTGNADDWTYFEYELDDYIGESVFIRIRYVINLVSSTNLFLIDDIYPIAHYEEIKTLSDSINNYRYEVTNNPQGDYYYRVRGFNDAHGWGDFSELEKIKVGIIDSNPPSIPIITGPNNGKKDVIYEYEIVSEDPDLDDIYYYITWDDATDSIWIGPYSSGETIIVEHSWTKNGFYNIKVKARDENGVESEWGTFKVRMVKNNSIREFIMDFFRFLPFQIN